MQLFAEGGVADDAEGVTREAFRALRLVEIAEALGHCELATGASRGKAALRGSQAGHILHQSSYGGQGHGVTCGGVAVADDVAGVQHEEGVGVVA
ncbi:hypothetical protein GOP47_0014899 [Adiantum capillus-veneris]|uniref:Uncharacterized protein n=1 Tax=Adiantum capillus-veneris TaxID=13818 RepID=A0A9D4ZF88_ADICA|nr:hypothetical protein GOP47_0014899 [Adiantum capillus-veneris]